MGGGAFHFWDPQHRRENNRRLASAKGNTNLPVLTPMIDERRRRESNDEKCQRQPAKHNSAGANGT